MHEACFKFESGRGRAYIQKEVGPLPQRPEEAHQVPKEWYCTGNEGYKHHICRAVRQPHHPLVLGSRF